MGTYTELENAFLVNDKFVFEKDYAAHQGDSGINIKRSIEIDGNGHTIDAGGFTGIFQSENLANSGINVVIKNLMFKNTKGWGILVSNSKTIKYNIINCSFINCKAGNGAAINFQSDGGSLDISNSKFINNTATSYGGGAINLYGECTGIRNSIFENNNAHEYSGGAILVLSANKNGLVIENCSFKNNHVLKASSAHHGGAIDYRGKGNVRVINSNFTDNSVERDKTWFFDMEGGAIYCGNKLELGGCNFINNWAQDCGGAVYTDVLSWLENPCTFINNRVSTGNTIYANKGGAIYASTFANMAYGHTFINNTGYYGGAIYINNKNDIIFQSCYFEGNVAMTESKTQGSGAAIYVDSSGSTVTMVDNIFIDNKATSDSGVFNCGEYRTYANNWWGTNNPDFNTAKYIVEWHRVKSNEVLTEHRHLRAYLNATQSPDGSTKLTVYFINNQGEAFNGKLTNFNVEFSSDKGGVFTNKEITDNKATVSFTANSKQETVTAKINNQLLTLSVNQTEGEFEWLQKQIDAASGTFDLTRDVTYTIGMDTITEGIKIGKAITINGNGHKINAQGKSRIFDISETENIVINNITFMNGFTDTYGGAIKMNTVNNAQILNSNFINNTAEESSGAILAENGIELIISNCEFTNNKNYKYVSGAINLIRDENVLIEKSKFTNNTASYGGAIAISGDKNITIDNCEFRLNTALKSGGAIYNNAEDVTVKNSIFFDNKADAYGIEYTINDTALTLALVGGANYMNAIESDEIITFSNVTYWNGQITTDNSPIRSSNESGVNIALVIKDNQNRAIMNVTLITDANGQIIFYFDKLKDGKYTFNATHFEDSYYTQVSEDDEFFVSNIHTYPSDVKINMENGTEFTYGNVNITFEVTNRTFVEVVITNNDFTQLFYDNETNLSYVMVDLPASDEFYNIIVFNHGNETYDPTSAEKAFKIIKTNSTVKIDPIADVNYSDSITVTFTGDASSYEVTLYDEWGNIVFNQSTNGNSIKIPGGFAVGTYNITVVARGDENRTESKNSTKFNITPKENRIVISADDAVYGSGVVVCITATADGEYTAHINSTNVIIQVNNGYGSEALELAAGTYTTNVSFNSPDYINVIETYNFTVTKAQSNVEITMGNVTYGQNTTVYITDDFPTEYNITIMDSGNNILFDEVITDTSFAIPPLEVGQYNLTVTNIGNENITGSELSITFSVTRDNNVEIIIDDTEYGRELLILIFADVDGYYTVDINGTQLTIEVEDGFGYDNTLELDAGKYYANVTYDNPDYNNIIENTTFIIYQAESRLEISEIENITYGEDVTISYYDDYNATFNVVIIDENEDIVFNIYTNATTVIISDFAAGNYTVMVTNEGDKNIIGTSEFKNFTVKKATPYIQVTAENVTYPDDVIITVLSNVTGNYTVEFAGETKDIILEVNKKYEFIYKKLTPDNYEFKVSYGENENYTDASTTVPITVSKADTELIVSTAVDNKDVNFTITVNPNATGNVEINIAGKKFYAPITNGTATFTNSYPTGIYVANVTYPGDDNFNKASKNVQFIISEIIPLLNNTPITIDVETEDNEALIIVKVNETATGLIAIEIGEDTIYLPVNSGIVVDDILLPAGNYTVTATYLGDDAFNPNSTSTTFNVTGFIIKNTTIEMKYVMEGNDAIIGIHTNVTGELTVYIDGSEQSIKLEDDGTAILSIPSIGYDKHIITAIYAGDDRHKAASASITIQIDTYATKFENVTINKYELIAKLVANDGKTLSNQNITYIVDGKEYNTTTDDEGLIKMEGIAGKVIELKYKGNGTYLPTSFELNLKDLDPEKQNTTIDIEYEIKGTEATITVNTNAYGDLLIFIDDNKNTVNINEKGIATLTIPIDYGEHSVVAVFEGNDDYKATENTTTIYLEAFDTQFANVTIDKYGLTATLAIATGDPLANQTVTVIVDGKEYSQKTNEIGQIIIEDAIGKVIELKYEGKDAFMPTNLELNLKDINPEKQNTTINIEYTINGTNATLTIKTNTIGELKVYIDGEETIVKTDTNGTATLTVPINYGEHSVVAVYEGDDDYKPAENTTTIYLEAFDTKFTNVTVDKYGLTATLTITTGDPLANQTVTIIVDGKEINVTTDNNGLIIVEDAIGKVIELKYEGKDAFMPTNLELNLKDINPEKQNTTINIEYTINGTNATLTIKTNTIGELKVYIDGEETIVKTDTNGTATLTVPINYGEHSVVAVFEGDDDYKPAENTTTIYLEAFDTKFANVTIEKNTLTAILVAATGDPLANQSIIILVDGKEYETKTNADGMIVIEDILNSVVELKYNGDGPFMPTSVEINLKNLTVQRETTEIMSKDFEQYACDFYEGERGGNFTFRLIDSNGKPIANETIYIGYNGVTYNRTTDKNGYANVQINLKNAGLYTFAVVYLGSDNYEATLAVHKITINKKKTTITAPAKTYKVATKTKKYTVTLKTIKGASIDGKTYLAKGKKITLKVNGKTYTAKTNAKGQATFKITNLKKKGKFTAAIKFAGDNTYNAASKKAKLTIK